LDSETEKLLNLIGCKAQNLHRNRHLHCSEAVLLVLNKGLGGGLSQEIAIRLASALPDGLGGGGCICGAVSGGVLALGLFLGRSRPRARDKHKAVPAAREFHRRTQGLLGSVCCSVLKREKSRCVELTGSAARLAAELILQRRPELTQQADWAYLEKQDRRLMEMLDRGKMLILSKSVFEPEQVTSPCSGREETGPTPDRKGKTNQ